MSFFTLNCIIKREMCLNDIFYETEGVLFFFYLVHLFCKLIKFACVFIFPLIFQCITKQLNIIRFPNIWFSQCHPKKLTATKFLITSSQPCLYFNTLSDLTSLAFINENVHAWVYHYPHHLHGRCEKHAEQRSFLFTNWLL